MRKINLEIQAEFKVNTKESLEFLEWVNYIPYETDENLEDLDINELLDHIKNYVIGDIEFTYGPFCIIDTLYLHLISAYEEKSESVRHF